MVLWCDGLRTLCEGHLRSARRYARKTGTRSSTFRHRPASAIVLEPSTAGNLLHTGPRWGALSITPAGPTPASEVTHASPRT
jgi:hypothetical protein